MGHIPNWSASSTTEKYGWGIVQVAKWCHHRKGERCTSPFPKGELCTIENCVMRPQDFADMFPEDFLALANERDSLRDDISGRDKRIAGLESALAGEKAAREHDRSVRWALPKAMEDGCPDDIRALGWAVAVHNDYRLGGVKHTFWLFTKGDRCVKGEGLTDAEALNQVRAALGAGASA